MAPLPASECISPAFQHTKRQFFQPFRFAFWLRLAILGFLTGELSGGGFNFNFRGFSNPRSSVHWPFPFPSLNPAQIALIVVVALALGMIFAVVFTYINSILRFVLFESILTGDTRIVEGWKKWRAHGRRFFVFQLLLLAVSTAFTAVLVGIPLAFLFFSGRLRHFHFELSMLLWIIPVVGILLVVSFVMAVVQVLTKDFVVPMMALEGIGWREGWSRFWPALKAKPGEYTVYLLLKIALRIGVGIVYGIAFFIVAMIILIPVILLVILGVAAAMGSSIVVKAILITIGIVVGIFVFGLLMLLSAFVGAPVAYFFPSYSVFFYASRYEPLGRIVYPASPPPAPFAPPQPPPATA